MSIKYTVFVTELCDVILAGNSDGLLASHLQTEECRRSFRVSDFWERDDDFFISVTEQLESYFAGNLQKFNIKLQIRGTAFQCKVWRALQNIPWGEVRTYKDISKEVTADIKACRAVGMANSRNPLPLFIPCHRVIGVNGKLTGYAYGLTIKEKLLKLEKKMK